MPNASGIAVAKKAQRGQVRVPGWLVEIWLNTGFECDDKSLALLVVVVFVSNVTLLFSVMLIPKMDCRMSVSVFLLGDRWGTYRCEGDWNINSYEDGNDGVSKSVLDIHVILDRSPQFGNLVTFVAKL